MAHRSTARTPARRGFPNSAEYGIARRRGTWSAPGLVPDQPVVPLSFVDQRVTCDLVRSFTRCAISFASSRRVLELFDCAEEWLRPAPTYDFSLLPAAGRAWYDRFD
jgi:hypothetical protein